MATRTSTPKRNSKRACYRESPWKINGDDSDESNDSFSFIKETPENDEIYTPPPMTVLDVSKMRSSKGIVYEEKSFMKRSKEYNTEKYEPENDAFIHSTKRINYDSDHLKKRIEYFLKSADVPDYKSAIQNLFKKEPVVKLRQPYKKRKKQVPQEPDPEVVDIGDDPHYGRSPPGAIRAMLYARQILLRIEAKRKYFGSLNDQETKYSVDTPVRSDLPHALGAPEQNPMDLTKNMQASSSTATENPQDHRSIESEILKGIVAYVDVISFQDEDMSNVVRKELMKLGATVVPTFTKKEPVSVVLFSNGHVSTYQKAKKRGIPLVSVLWIEECRRTGVQASMADFPAYKMERYECPKFVKEIKKRKFLYTGERIVPRKTRNRARKSESPKVDSKPKLEVATPEFTSRVEPTPEWVQKLEKESKGLNFLVGLTGVNEEQFKEMMDEPEDSEKYEFSPLPLRLLYRIAKDLSNSRDKSATSEKESSPSICTSGFKSNDSESVSVSTFSQPLDDKSLEATDDNIPKSQDKSTCLSNLDIQEKPLESTPKRRYSERIRNVKRKLAY